MKFARDSHCFLGKLGIDPIRSESGGRSTSSDERAPPRRYAGAKRRRGRPRVDPSIRFIRKQNTKKKHNKKMTTLQISRGTREKLRTFQNRHKLKGMDHVIQELLKYYPDSGIRGDRTPRKRNEVAIPEEKESEAEPELNKESLFRMAIIGRLVSGLGISQYMVPLCLAL